MAGLNLRGDTSGSVEIVSPAVAGDTTLTLPTTDGTILVDTGVSITGLSTFSNGIQVGTASTIIGVGQTTLIGHESQQLTSFNDPNATTLALVDKNNNVQLQLRGTSPILFFDITSGGNGRIFTDTSDFKINTGRPSSFDAANDKVTIDSSGNVGIGTDNPSEPLHVMGDILSDGGYYRTKTGTEGGLFDVAGNNGWTVDQHILRGYTSGNERLRITSAGDVGIGTDNPTTKVEVQSSANDSLDNPQTIFLRDRNTAGQGKGPGLTFGFDYSASGNHINRAGQIKCIKENSTDDNYASALIFGTTQHGASTAERLRITSAGNLEIANGNLVFSTSGTGIDFSATGQHAGMSSELLDDYEEGVYASTLTCGSGSITLGNKNLAYTRIGRLVHVQGLIQVSSVSSPSGTVLLSVPFTIDTTLSQNSDNGTSAIQVSNAGVDADRWTLNVGTSSGMYIVRTNRQNPTATDAGSSFSGDEGITVSFTFITS